MKFYIKSSSCISPQHTFLKRTNWHEEIVQIPATGMMYITEIPYKEYIQVKNLRRMKRNVRMGMTCAKDALALAGMQKPDAIVVGSSLGIVEDTETFLNQIIDQSEQMLNPTAFIQSTHNTVAGQIALAIGCKMHNLTFSQFNASFEHALLDGMLLLEDDKTVNNILVGAQDELTQENYEIYGFLKKWKTEKEIQSLYDPQTAGSIAGEGAAYFVVTQEKAPVEIVDIDLFNKPASVNLESEIETFLSRNNIGLSAVDAVMFGMNGDVNTDGVYHDLIEGIFANNNICNYKHLCGNQPSASAFAYWLANEMLITAMSNSILYKKRNDISQPKIVLIYHQENGANHCLSLLRKVE